VSENLSITFMMSLSFQVIRRTLKDFVSTLNEFKVISKVIDRVSDECEV
jgi:hypothetical protein